MRVLVNAFDRGDGRAVRATWLADRTRVGGHRLSSRALALVVGCDSTALGLSHQRSHPLIVTWVRLWELLRK